MHTPHSSWPLTRFAATLVTLCTLLFAGCGSSPQIQLYQLRADPPASASAPSSAAPTAVSQRWAVGRVRLPDYLDRDAILRPNGQAGMSALKDQQWAEPLRDAVPRLLLQDLARLRGANEVWRLPLPAGVSVARELQVEIEQFEATSDGSAVMLAARWILIDPSGNTTAQVFHSRIRIPSAEPTPDALVNAHRVALWAFAQDIQARGG